MNQSETTETFKKTMPVIPKATHFFINSGNIVSSDRIKKRTNLNPQDEVN
jgi:hypothetical protein